MTAQERAEVFDVLCSADVRVMVFRALAVALLCRLPGVFVQQLDRALADKSVAKEIIALAEMGPAPPEAAGEAGGVRELPSTFERAMLNGLREAMGFGPIRED